jgi:flagellar motor switch protein FliM
MTEPTSSPDSASLSGTASGPPEETSQSQEVAPYDFHKASRFGEKQLECLRLIHESLGRGLDRSLGSTLRCPVAATLNSVEPISYEGFLQNASEATFLCSLSLPGMESAVALEMDCAILLPLLDLLLGGAGNAEQPPRPVTEIEDQILEKAVRTICQQVQSIWQPLLKSDLRFERRVQQQQFHLLMPLTERLLVLHFELTAGGAHGAMKVALPTAVSNALLQEFSRQWTLPKRATPGSSRQQLQHSLQKCHFPVELVLAGLRVPLRQLKELEAGTVLAFRHRVEEPALVFVSGKGLFAAHPVASGSQRAAQIRGRVLAHESERSRDQ